MTRIHYPPGTPREIRKRVDAWKLWRQRCGLPCPCWGWYLLSLENVSARALRAREAARTAMERRRLARLRMPAPRGEAEVNAMRAELSRIRINAALAGRPLPRRCWI